MAVDPLPFFAARVMNRGWKFLIRYNFVYIYYTLWAWCVSVALKRNVILHFRG